MWALLRLGLEVSAGVRRSCWGHEWLLGSCRGVSGLSGPASGLRWKLPQLLAEPACVLQSGSADRINPAHFILC